MPGPNPLPAGPVAAVKGLVLPFQLPLQPPWRWPRRSLMGAMRSGPPQAQYWDREGLFSHVIWKIVIYLESAEKPPRGRRLYPAAATRTADGVADSDEQAAEAEVFGLVVA